MYAGFKAKSCTRLVADDILLNNIYVFMFLVFHAKHKSVVLVMQACILLQ